MLHCAAEVVELSTGVVILTNNLIAYLEIDLAYKTSETT
jgi:hypothetical protein